MKRIKNLMKIRVFRNRKFDVTLQTGSYKSELINYELPCVLTEGELSSKYHIRLSCKVFQKLFNSVRFGGEATIHIDNKKGIRIVHRHQGISTEACAGSEHISDDYE